VFGVRYRQRPEQQRIHQREDGDVGAEAQRERQNDDERKPGLLTQATDGEAKVVGHGVLAIFDGTPGRTVARTSGELM
jgi:hypothetical protein